MSTQNFQDSSALLPRRLALIDLAWDRDAASRDASGEIMRRLTVCVALLAMLMVWAWLWPQTGDGDAIMHFLNARDGLWQPDKLMGSSARVGAKLPLLIPAQFGVLAARWMSALISVICAWQTIRLADDLKIRGAILAAPLLLLQPLVFGLAADTMTELPMALGLVIAIRLWWARRTLASCLVMGYLPLVRPEGFFFCAMWGAMLLGTGRIGPLHRRISLGATLAWGTLAWLGACWFFSGDATYFFRGGWAWPADSMPVYGRGSFFAHINRWPVYCGPILFPLFLLGLHRLGRHKILLVCAAILLILELTLPAWPKEHLLPWPTLALAATMAWARGGEKIAIAWWAFLLVFSIHSVLWWQGWFASCGLMRILACVSPITAVICLRGWNLAGEFSRRWNLELPARQWIGRSLLALLALWAGVMYIGDRSHYRVFPLQRASDFVAAQHLTTTAPIIIFGDPMAQAYLRMAANPLKLLRHYSERDRELERLVTAPVGSVGLWDNQHAQEWFNVGIEDLPKLGYTLLYDIRQKPPALALWFTPAWAAHDMHYVVIRKDRAGKLPE